MKKLTNLIGSFIVTIAIIAFPMITGIGIASDWLEHENNVLIHPWLTLLWILCFVCTITEAFLLTLAITNYE